MAAYHLQKHVYFCNNSQAAILLDVRKDKYLGLTSDQSRALGGVVHGWPVIGSSTKDTFADGDALVKELMQMDLITRDASAGKCATSIMLEPARCALFDPDIDERPNVSTMHVFKFFAAWLLTLLRLRFYPFEKLVRRAEDRKLNSESAPFEFDLYYARQLMGIFCRLRPFVYSRRDRCLLDTLVLIEFLSSFDVFPHWIIGVKTGPFAAHSWVQHGNYVFNGTPSYVAAYTPIMAV